jgi:hypothetical protein
MTGIAKEFPTMLDQVPHMSATAASFIRGKLLERRQGKRYIIEYGSGGSTLYFTSALEAENLPCTYVAVERHHQWYRAVAETLQLEFYDREPWGVKGFLRFLLATPARGDIPAECRRLGRHKRNMLKMIPRDLLRRRLDDYFCTMRYRGTKGAMVIDYVYVYEGFKDQFGESPNKQLYIDEPLAGLLEDAERGERIYASAIVDGGPRADVSDRMLSLSGIYPNVECEVFLLDAGRGFYVDLLNSHPHGRFVGAEENVRVDGTPYLQPPHTFGSRPCDDLMASPTLAHALETDLWYCTSNAEADITGAGAE